MALASICLEIMKTIGSLHYVEIITARALGGIAALNQLCFDDRHLLQIGHKQANEDNGEDEDYRNVPEHPAHANVVD